MPKISVIIPVYNTEAHLSKCLDSVLMQTLNDFEIIIINDGSPDNSQEIIDKYKTLYGNKIVAQSQENAGQSCARNNGIAIASGEYIAFVDSDDYLAPHAFEKTYSYATENALDIVCFNFYEVKGDQSIPVKYRICESNDVRKKYILNETSPCNKLIKREIFANNHLSFSQGRIYEDLELIPQLALYTEKIGFMDDHLYYYIIHENSTMRQKEYDPKLASIYAVAETLKENFLDTKYIEELEFLYIEHLLHGAVLRYLGYREGKKDIYHLTDIMKSTFPSWYKNIYFKRMNIKYKIVCWLAYFKQIKMLQFLLGVKNA